MSEERLPKIVVPNVYKLKLQSIPTNNIFYGTVEIDINVLEDTNKIILSERNINVVSNKLKVKGEELIAKLQEVINKQKQTDEV